MTSICLHEPRNPWHDVCAHRGSLPETAPASSCWSRCWISACGSVSSTPSTARQDTEPGQRCVNVLPSPNLGTARGDGRVAPRFGEAAARSWRIREIESARLERLRRAPRQGTPNDWPKVRGKRQPRWLAMKVSVRDQANSAAWRWCASGRCSFIKPCFAA
jgi:hypothetical protein